MPTNPGSPPYTQAFDDDSGEESDRAGDPLESEVPGRGVATPMLLLFAAAGNIPRAFTTGPVFVTINIRAREPDHLPSLADILRQIANQPAAPDSARDLIRHVLSDCPSAQVWTGSSMLPADYTYSPAVNTPPIGRATCHGTITALLDGRAPTAQSPRVCYEPASFLGQMRQALAPRLGIHNPSAISVHFVFFQHFMLRDPTQPRATTAPTPPAPLPRAQDTAGHQAAHRLPAASQRTAVHAPNPLNNHGMAAVSAVSAVPVPAPAGQPQPPAPASIATGGDDHRTPDADADTDQPPDTPEFLVKAIALAFPQAALDIARCLPFSMPPNQRGRRRRNPFATEYGTAYASWRIYAHIQRTCAALSLDVHEPSRSRMVRFSTQTCQVCCWDVLRAFSIAPSTWNSAKTRFSNLHVAATRLQAGTTEAERLLLHKLNFFLQDVSKVDPLAEPLKFMNEHAIWNWGTEAFRRELRPWMTPASNP